MAKLNDLTGMVFGSWVVLYRNGSTPNKASVWRCRCILCGSERDVVGASLTGGVSTKCRACVPRQTLSKGGRKTRLYHIWTAMKQRCSNPSNARFDDYGGRGISVCTEWLSFDAFASWSVANGYADQLTIDRIDVDGGYAPENCRWIPAHEQASNRRGNVRISFNGMAYPTLASACASADVVYDRVRDYKRRHGVDYQTAFDRCLQKKQQAIPSRHRSFAPSLRNQESYLRCP